MSLFSEEVKITILEQSIMLSKVVINRHLGNHYQDNSLLDVLLLGEFHSL